MRWVPAWLWIVPMVLLSSVPSHSLYARDLWFGSFVVTGCALAGYRDWWLQRRWFLPVGLIVAAVGYSAWTLLPGLAHEHETIPAYLGSVAGVLGIVWLAPRLPRSRVLQRAGQNSIVIYLAHFGVIGGLFRLLHPLIGAGTLMTAILLTGGLGASWLVIRWRHSLLVEGPHLPARRSRRASPTP